MLVEKGGVVQAGLQDVDGSWAGENDPDDHCRVPSISTLDQTELKAWARLTGTSWARLAGSTNKGGMTTITLDRNIHDWEVGDEIVIGATDWYPNHSEQRTIRKITPLEIGTQIEVDVLKFSHAFTNSTPASRATSRIR